MQKTTKSFFLHTSEIDQCSQLTADLLQQMQINSRDIIRFRLSIENVMGIWMHELGENAKCTFTSGSKLGRTYIILSAEGKKVNPNEYQDELETSISDGSSLLATLGLVLEYHYENGRNYLKLALPKKPVGQLSAVLAGIILGIICGAILTFGLPDIGSTVQDWIISPLFNTFMNLLKLIAGPMIFLAVYCGINEMGDAANFGKIGKTLITRFILFIFLNLVAVGLMISWMFISSGNNNISGSSLMDLYQMILDIIPSDIISPFQTGNALQIIFLACVCGVGTLVLGDSVSGMAKRVSQLNTLIQLLMTYIGKLIPIFVFICMMNLFLSGNLSNISSMVKQIIIVVVVSMIILAFYVGLLCWKCKVKPAILIKKMLPTYIIAISTASSSAAFGTNLESCEEMGVDKKLINFGISLGQVIYMPVSAINFFVASLCIGQSLGTQITLIWIIISMITSTILAMAAPPIPGGALSCYTILFTQLGIPSAGIALVISIDVLMDAFITAGNLAYLQTQLVLSAKKLDLLDEAKLRW